jgi:FtsH-binding integral membrane protein
MKNNSLVPLVILFLGLSLLFFLVHVFLPESPVDYRVLMVGNLLLFLVGIVSSRMNIRAMKHQHTQGFLRLVYSAFIFKFFVLAIAAFIYIAVVKKMVNKPALFGCLGLYFVYTFFEMRSVMKMSKKPNA